MQSKYHIKLICGFRKDQEYTINANEAHKAYYLFNNPDKRGTFNNGLSIKGSDIQRIVPDYQTTMGWNPDHILTSDDYNEIHGNGVMNKLRDIMVAAKEVARLNNPQDFTEPLVKLVKSKYQFLTDRSGSEFSQQLLGDVPTTHLDK